MSKKQKIIIYILTVVVLAVTILAGKEVVFAKELPEIRKPVENVAVTEQTDIISDDNIKAEVKDFSLIDK